VELVELKEKTTLSREAAAARLHAIADELASGNDVVIERDDLRSVAHVPDQVHLRVDATLASAVRNSVAQVDDGGAKKLKAALAEAQAGMSGGPQ
jgi:amphi-Trp domain-containing protein